MEQLDFSLPETPRKRRLPLLSWLNLIAATAALVLIALVWSSLDDRSGAAPAAARSAGDGETLRKVAEDLERRTLYLQAAEAWQEYAASTALDPEERARVLYRRARNLQQAGSYAEAARLLTQYEHLDVPRDDRRQGVRLLSECLSALGKEEVRENLLRAYTIPGAKEEGTVVARIGGEAVTREDLRRELARQTRRALELRGAALHPDELERQADDLAAKRLEDPKAVQQVLQQFLQREVLYREALSRKYQTTEEYAESLDRLRRDLLAGRLVEDVLRQALEGIGPSDLRNHYEAHKEDYVEKPAVDFSYQKHASEEAARRALEDRADSDFVPGGGAAVQGEPIPGLGRSAEATAHLLALDEGKTGDRPIPIGEAWYIFRCDEKRPKRQKTFEEALEEVRADVARVKQEEALAKLQAELERKFDVEVLPNALQTTPAGGSEPPEEKAADAKEDDAPTEEENRAAKP